MNNEKKLTKHFISLSIIVSISLFIIISVSAFYYNYSIKRESAFHISKVVEGMLKSHQYREVIYSLSNAKSESFDAIGYYDFEGNRVFILPPSLGPDYFKEEKSLFSKLTIANITVDIFFDDKGENRAGTIFYAFNHSNVIGSILLVWIIGILFLFPIFYKYKTLIKSGIERDILEEKNRGIKETVRQVWHDLNQPMQLLYALAENGREMGDYEREKIKSACDDMQSILDDLKEKRDQLEKGQITTVCLAASIKEIIEKENLKLSTKKITVQLSITKKGFAAFSDLNENELKRIMCNLIDNAAQASSPMTSINVELKQDGNSNLIEIKDEGHGIKSEHLAVIGKRGVSFREGGNGVGLNYSIEKVEHWGGKFSIDSKYGKGTTIRIELPKADVPSWFSGTVALDGINEFILIDDRPVIHTLVEEKLNKLNSNVTRYFHRSPQEFESWYSKNKKNLKSPFFLFDYDMGEEEKTGIELIQDYDLESSSILLTNFYDDSTVQIKADHAKVKIFPKGLIEYIGV